MTDLDRLGRVSLADVVYAPADKAAVLAFSPGAQDLALGLEDGTLHVLRAANGAQR